MTSLGAEWWKKGEHCMKAEDVMSMNEITRRETNIWNAELKYLKIQQT